MRTTAWREWLIGLTSVAALLIVFSFPPIPQEASYHHFADARTILGAPNFWNVFSNLAFLLVGLFGFSQRHTRTIPTPQTAYLIFCLGVFFVGVGSAYYHNNPTPETLVWDRLPMTIAFMALFSMVLSDRISAKLGAQLLWPLLIAGAAAVFYWAWTEAQGQGDLRAYALIQFLPMLLIPMMLALYPKHLMNSGLIWATLGSYAIAKVTEHFDAAIYQQLQFISGHSLKHLLGAIAVLWIILSFSRTQSKHSEEALSPH